MRGEFKRAWRYMWPEVWQRLTSHPDAGKAILCEVYEAIEVLPARLPEGERRPSLFRTPVDDEKDIDLRNDADAAAEFFERLSGRRFLSEQAIVNAIERIAAAIQDAYPQTVVDRFRSLIRGFVKRHGLQYRIVEPLHFQPCAEGIVCGIFQHIRDVGKADPHIRQLFDECEEAFGDLRDRQSEARVKSCIGKQINLAEVLAGRHVRVNNIRFTRLDHRGREVENDRPALSAMIHRAQIWPHDEVKFSLLKYYDFANSYPGIRHQGQPDRRVQRPLQLRDAMAGLVITIVFAAYLSDANELGAIFGV